MRRSWSSVSRWVLVGWIVAAAALPRTARAAEPGSSAELVEQGLSLRRARDDSGALDAFQRAYRAAPSPMILAQIALAEQALGRFVAAEQHLTESLASTDPWIEGHRSPLASALGVIQSRLGWLEVRAVGAVELRIDGSAVPLSASPFRLLAGEHELVLRGRGGEAIAHAFDLEPRSRHVYQLELIEAPAPAPRISPPRAPLPASPALAPTRTAAQPNRVPRAWAYATAALAGVALADAVAATLLRQSYVTTYNGPSCEPDRSQRCASYRSSANTLGTLAVVGYAVAGAAGVTSIVLLTEPWWQGQSANAKQTALLGVAGRF